MKFLKKNLFSIILLIIIIVQTIYYNYRFENIRTSMYGLINGAVNLAERLDTVISLNNLEHYNYVIITDEAEWKPLLKEETGLTIPDNWKISDVKVKKYREHKKSSEFTLIFDLDDELSFDDMANGLYNKIEELSFDGDPILSFNKRYYEIKSFDEATYNNMYYDYIEEDSETGTYGGPRIKLKLLYLEDTNQAKLEVNIY